MSLSMNFQRTARFLLTKHLLALESGKAPEPVMLMGPPGIGKSAIARAVALALRDGAAFDGRDFPAYSEEALCEVVDLTSTLPEDLGGFPTIVDTDDGGKQTIHAPMRWYNHLCEPGAVGILLLDDVPAAAPSVATAARQIILDRSINGNKLSDGVLIVGTGNRAEDGASASVLPSHFRNAVCMIEIEPDIDSWHKWYAQRDGDPVVSAFLKHKPDLFSSLPGKADKKGSFATPRSWAKLSEDLPAAQSAGCVQTVASGWVGEGNSVAFAAFCDMFGKLPPAADILADPEATVPKPKELMSSPDRALGATISIGYEAARQQRALSNARGKAADNIPEAEDAAYNLIRATAWLAHGHYEYLSMSITSYADAGGSGYCLNLGVRRLIKEGGVSKDFMTRFGKILSGN